LRLKFKGQNLNYIVAHSSTKSAAKYAGLKFKPIPPQQILHKRHVRATVKFSETLVHNIRVKIKGCVPSPLKFQAIREFVKNFKILSPLFCRLKFRASR